MITIPYSSYVSLIRVISAPFRFRISPLSNRICTAFSYSYNKYWHLQGRSRRIRAWAQELGRHERLEESRKSSGIAEHTQRLAKIRKFMTGNPNLTFEPARSVTKASSVGLRLPKLWLWSRPLSIGRLLEPQPARRMVWLWIFRIQTRRRTAN
jgi:hypothetical protein